jgi:hypothetical protein
MKSQTEIGKIERQSGWVRDRVRRGYRGHRSGSRTLGLILSLLVAAGAAELTTGAVAIAAPQTASSPDATAQSAGKSMAQDWHPQINLRFHNYSQIDARILLASEQIVSDILRKAGVDTVWLACSSGEGSHSDAECAKSLGATDLNLNFPLPSATKMYQRADSVYGFTLGNNAWVFFDRVKASALEYHLDTAQLLGNVIAHELGHLLLGDNAHSNWGLMRARWSPEQLRAADRKELSFSNIERVKIRDFVTASHQAESLAQAQRTPAATISTANNHHSL